MFKELNVIENFEKLSKLKSDYPSTYTDFFDKLVFYGKDKKALNKILNDSSYSPFVDNLNKYTLGNVASFFSYNSCLLLKEENASNFKKLIILVFQFITDLSCKGCCFIEINKNNISSTDDLGYNYYVNKDVCSENNETKELLELIQPCNDSTFKNNMHLSNIESFVNIFESLDYKVTKKEIYDFTSSSSNINNNLISGYSYYISWKKGELI